MTQEVTVGLRIKAFLNEARAAVRDFQKEIKAVGDTAGQTGAKIADASGGARFLDAGELRNIVQQWQNYRAGALPALQETDALLKKGAISAKQHAMALRQLPAQITDIATSLASGMPPWLVFIQQGGQIRDSFGGGTAALKGMLSVLTPVRLAIGGVAGAAVALALAYKKASDEQDAFNRSIFMSGNASGTTADDLQQKAEAVSRLVGTQAKAAEALTALVDTGNVGSENLERFAATAMKMERVTGQSVTKTATMFSELAKAPLQATMKFDESLHYVTLSLRDQIDALVKRGETEKAAELAQTALANALDTRTARVEASLGRMERAWKAVGDAIKGVGDRFLGLFREDTLQQRLDAVTKKIEKARGKFDPSAFGGNAELRAQLPQLLLEQASLQEQIRLTQRGAEAQAQASKTEEQATQARKDNAKWTEAAASKQKRLNDLLEQYHRNNEKIRAAGGVISPDQVKREEQAIRESVFGKGADLQDAKAGAALARAKIEANLRVLQATIRNEDAFIEQAVKEGSMTIDAAYAARLMQIQADTDAQREAYEAEAAEIEKALSKAKTQAERAPLLQQQVELQAKVKVLDANLIEQAHKLGIWKQEQERSLGAISAKIRVDVAGLTGKFDPQAASRQILESLRGEIQAVATMPEGPEKTTAANGLQLLQAAGLKQAEFNATLAETQRLQEQLSVTEQGLQIMQQQGAISQVEYEARVRAARAAQVPALESIVQHLTAIRDAMPPKAAAAIEAMTNAIEELKNKTKQAKPELVDLATKLRSAAIDGIANAAAEAVTNFQNMRTAISSIMKQIAGDLVRSGVKEALNKIFTPEPGGGGSIGGTFLSSLFAAGKSVFGYAEGGLIRGPGTGTSDSIPALVGGRRPISVSTNEFIQPERAVKHYGLGFMEAVRTLKVPKSIVPRFNFGGLASAQQRARFASGGAVGYGGGNPASAMMVAPVTVNVINNGTPQRISAQRQQFDGKQMVVSVILEDVNRGGPISQAMGARR